MRGLDLDVVAPSVSEYEGGGGGHYAPTCRVPVIEAGSLPYTFHPGWRGKLKSIQPMMRRLEWDRGEGGGGWESFALTDGWLKGADQLP